MESGPEWEPDVRIRTIKVLVLGASPQVTAALAAAGIECEPFERQRVAESAASEVPAVVIVCPQGTLTSGVAQLRELTLAEARVVLVCTDVRPGETRLAMAAGASGVVVEDSVASSLAACVEAVLCGQVCVPRRQARQIEPATLSAREKQILGMVVMGYMNSEIAAQLFVAESTVKSHLSSAFGKLDVRSRNEAVELILDSERGLGVGILGLESEPIAS